MSVSEYNLDMSTALRPIIKSFAGTLRQDGTGRILRRECWEATTADGEWAFERIEETGTPWIVVHHPRTPDAETATSWFGTLKAARQAVERGLDRWLPSTHAAEHAAGAHDERESSYGCRACDERRWGARR
jgi:hypothetical protein